MPSKPAILLAAVSVAAGTVSAAAVPAATAAQPPVCRPTEATPNAKLRARMVWAELRLAGYSPQASAGVLGALDNASAFAPMAQSRNRTRFGLAQWRTERWRAYVASVEATGHNRWGPLSQLTYLIADMQQNPGAFVDHRFRRMTDPAAAARAFHRSYLGRTADRRGGLRSAHKARAWYRTLRRSAVRQVPSGRTQGIRVPCQPRGVVLGRCPEVPLSFKSDFKTFTGFSWDRLSFATRRMSSCVYVNFPSIVAHGTYRGHMPVWRRALDFLVQHGCSQVGAKRRTNSAVDRRLGDRLADYLTRNNGRLGLRYQIWQDRIRSGGRFAWRADRYNNGDCTNTHFDHVHASTY